MSQCDARKRMKITPGSAGILACGVALLTELPAGKDGRRSQGFSEEEQ